MCGIFGISQSNLNLNNFDNILRDIEIYVDTSQKRGLIPLDYLLN